MAETRNVIRWISEGVEKVRSDYAQIKAASEQSAKGFDEYYRSVKRSASANTEAYSSTMLMNSGLTALGRTLMAYAAPAAIGAAIKGATDFTSRILDNAAAAGISTTRYQEMVFALTQSGLKVEQADMALATFNSKLGDAARGNKQLADAFKNLGVNVDAVTAGQMTTQQALDKTIASLEGMDDAALRASATADVFGEKAGRKLAAALGQGKEEIDRLIQSAHDLGIVLNEDMVKKGEAAGDKIDALWFIIKSKFSVAVVEAIDFTSRWGDELAGLSGKLVQNESDFVHWADTHKTEWGVLQTMATGYLQLVGIMPRPYGPQAPAGKVTGTSGSGGASPRGSFGGMYGLPSGMADKYGGFVPVPTDRPNPPDTSDSIRAAEAAAKAAEDWQQKIRDGWFDLRKDVEKASDDFTRKIGDDVSEAMGKANDAYTASQKAVQDYVAAVDRGIEISGMSARAQAIATAQDQAAAQAKRELTDAEKAQVTAAAGRQYDNDKVIAAAKKAADDIEAIWTQAAQGVNDAWSDFLFDIFDKGKLSFKSFANSLKSTWARTIADMIALSTQQSIVQPLFNAMFGGMQGGGTGAAGTMGAFAKIGGGSDSMGSLADLGDGSGLKVSNGGGFGSLTKGNTSLGGLAGGAMMGMGLGAMTGSGMAGAAGGAIGMAVGGPIGAAIGGLIGGLVGGLFKSTPKSISSYGTSGVVDSVAGGGLDVKIGKDMASGVVRALRTFSEQLLTGIESDEFLGIVGQRGKKFFFQSQQSDLKSAGKGKYGAVKFDSAEEAIAAAIEAAINSGVVKGLTDADKKLMRAAGSVEQAMQDVIASHDFKRELDFQFTGLSNPLAEAQARLEFEYQQQLILADKYEADKTKLEAVYAQKRLDLVKQYNDQQNAAMEQSLGGLKAYLFDLTGGSASPLSPTNRLNLAQTNYNSIKSRALAGDKDAIAQLQGASQDFLSASRSVFGSASGFQTNYQNVVATLSQITGSANPLGAANNNAAAAVNDNTRVQAAYAERAATQRSDTNAKLDTVISLLAASSSSAQRGSPSPTQNGVVPVGTVDFSAIQQAVAGIRW